MGKKTSKPKSSEPIDYEEGFAYVPDNLDRQYNYWATIGKRRCKAIKLLRIDRFNARWMKEVYGRSECYPTSSLTGGRGRHSTTFNLGMWLAADGRVFARFWSRSKYVDPSSFVIVGFSLPPDVIFDEQHVPNILRDAYADWQILCWEDPC